MLAWVGAGYILQRTNESGRPVGRARDGLSRSHFNRAVGHQASPRVFNVNYWPTETMDDSAFFAQQQPMIAGTGVFAWSYVGCLSSLVVSSCSWDRLLAGDCPGHTSSQLFHCGPERAENNAHAVPE